MPDIADLRDMRSSSPIGDVSPRVVAGMLTRRRAKVKRRPVPTGLDVAQIQPELKEPGEW
jgi:hypothetical protein